LVVFDDEVEQLIYQHAVNLLRIFAIPRNIRDFPTQQDCVFYFRPLVAIGVPRLNVERESAAHVFPQTKEQIFSIG